MANGLEHLLSEGVISEVAGRLKGGKEADVYAVWFGGRLVAAKVYKDRSFRSFKNNAGYLEGRGVRSSRSQRAMDRKTSFGQATAEAAWKAAEADALYKLHAAEVRVPAPVLFLDGVLLMELVLDAAGDPAPRLIDTDLTPAEARAAYHDMLTQLVRILSCDLIHGDLSPYNVLWGVNGATIIDFPQIVSASHNSRSESFFVRDAKNILGFFASIDRSLEERSGDANEIWRAYVRRELTPDFVPTGRSPSRERSGRAEAPSPRAPNHGAQGPQAQNHGAQRPQAQNHGAQRPQAQNHGAQRPQAQNTGAQRPQAPNHGAQRPQAPNHGAQRPQAPNHGAQRPQAPNHGAQRPQGPNHGAQRPQAKKGPSRRAPMPEVIVQIARGPRG